MCKRADQIAFPNGMVITRRRLGAIRATLQDVDLDGGIRFMSAVADVRHVSPLAVSATVEAGGVLGRAFVDDPLMRYYFEGR